MFLSKYSPASPVCRQSVCLLWAPELLLTSEILAELSGPHNKVTVDISAVQRATGGHTESQKLLRAKWNPERVGVVGLLEDSLDLSSVLRKGKLGHFNSHFLSPVCLLLSLPAFLSPCLSVHLIKNILNADYVPRTALNSGDTKMN